MQARLFIHTSGAKALSDPRGNVKLQRMQVRLSLQQLSAFLTLAETGGFGDAAEALGVSQPALSRTIQQIESRLGARLFDRDTRKLRLTPAGERLEPLARRMLAEYQNAFAEFDDFVAGRQGAVRIAALPSVAAMLLPGTIARFRERQPDVRIHISEDVGRPVHRAVLDGAADIGLATAPPITSDLRYKPLLRDEVVLVCRADDMLAQRDEHPWSVFANRAFVMPSPETGLRAMIDQALDKAGVSAEPLFNCKQPTTIGALVNAGIGVAALTRLTLAQLDSPTLAYRKLRNPTAARSIGVVTHAARSLAPAAKLFLKELDAQARVLAPTIDGSPRAGDAS
jgi:LysR family transcriptional regulator, carnitine catabolism transcriptional activator